VFAVGAGPGGLPLVDVYDAGTGAFKFQFQAFETGFSGGVRVAVARSNGQDYIAVSAGPGGFLVRTFLVSGNGATPVGQFEPFGTFQGGIFVALGDLNGDGNLEVVAGPDQAPNCDPYINVWSLDGKVQISGNVYAFEQGFHGGVRVAVSDLNGDGKEQILAAAGPSGFPYVQVINGRTFQKQSRFEVFDHGFRGGVFVAGGVLDSSGLGRVIVGEGGDGVSSVDAPAIRAFDGGGGLLRDYQPTFEPTYHGGVDVATVHGLGQDFDSTLVAPAGAHSPMVFVYDAAFDPVPDSFRILNPKTKLVDANFISGTFVG
jgi:serralysin